VPTLSDRVRLLVDVGNIASIVSYETYDATVRDISGFLNDLNTVNAEGKIYHIWIETRTVL